MQEMDEDTESRMVKLMRPTRTPQNGPTPSPILTCSWTTVQARSNSIDANTNIFGEIRHWDVLDDGHRDKQTTARRI